MFECSSPAVAIKQNEPKVQVQEQKTAEIEDEVKTTVKVEEKVKIVERVVEKVIEKVVVEEKPEQNERILELIKTLNNEMKFNTDQLTEAFECIDGQFNKINSEIKALGQCSSKRKEILDDFRTTVRAYSAVCDQEAFVKQFNVFFWLFQQQAVNPGYLQAFGGQFNDLIEKAKQGEMMAFKQHNQSKGNNSTLNAYSNQGSPQKSLNGSYLENSAYSGPRSFLQTSQVNFLYLSTH